MYKKSSEIWTKEQLIWLSDQHKAQIDRLWTWWKPRQEARRKASVDKFGMIQICASCKGHFPRKQTDCDHIQPTVDITSMEYDPILYTIQKLCQADNIQVLCKACHSQKSQNENAVRRTHKKENGYVPVKRKRRPKPPVLKKLKRKRRKR